MLDSWTTLFWHQDNIENIRQTTTSQAVGMAWYFIIAVATLSKFKTFDTKGQSERRMLITAKMCVQKCKTINYLGVLNNKAKSPVDCN